ncbi:antibiotic biosynthesis monooxygenase [Vibrio aestuarianus]|uniref:putative quinol monooxygenase n=1 Tax=Vibrio aestuarianus TaxID=28171 RepID=UPI00237C6013|nr:putative quinol monooxygenase [Vibrio aestuarianus]MDE1249757.1 antibiotic biosynthesis monooxygenase [Vibrio aestuarianus]
MASVNLIAEIKASQGNEKRIEILLTELLEPSRAETGCCQYELYRDQSIDGLFVMREIWCSEASLLQHQQSKHFQHFLAIVNEEALIEYIQPRPLIFIA